MLAALQHVRKQTRAPNDSNKPGRRLPLRLRPAGTRGRAAACSGAGHGGEARGGQGGARCCRQGSCSAGHPRDTRGTPGTRSAPPGHAPTLRERPAEPQLPGRPGSRGECAVPCPAHRSRPLRTGPSAAPAGKEKLAFTLVWVGGCKTQDTTPQSKFTFQRGDIKLS